jgi:hypothetical protein
MGSPDQLLRRCNSACESAVPPLGFSDEQPEHDFGSIATTWGQIVVRLKEVVESGGAPNPVLT